MPAWVRQQNCQTFSHLTMRTATFNLENLFRRAKVLNLRDSEKTTKLLDKIRQLASLLDEPFYTAPLRAEVFNLSAELREYIDIRKDFRTLGSWRKDTHTERTGFRVSRQAKGRSSWSGQIVFRFEDFSDQQRMNTALVVNSVNADIFCAIEVEGMEALRVFNRSVAATSYSEYIAIDSPNDPRGIALAVSPVFTSQASLPMFSISCPAPSAAFSAATAWSLRSTATRIRASTCSVITSRARWG